MSHPSMKIFPDMRYLHDCACAQGVSLPRAAILLTNLVCGAGGRLPDHGSIRDRAELLSPLMQARHTSPFSAPDSNTGQLS